MNTHKCDEKCKGRKGGVMCFLCKENFFLKCFGLDQSLHPKLASTESFIKFVCGRCQSKKRSSLSTSSIEHSKGTHLLNDNIKLLIDKLSLIKPGASTENPTTVIPDNGTQYAADESNDTTKTSIENIYKLVLKASDKLNQIHTSEMEKNNMGAISALIDNKFKELSNTLHA